MVAHCRVHVSPINIPTVRHIQPQQMVTREGGESIFISPTQYTAMEIPLDVPTHAGKAELGKIDARHKQPHTAYVSFL